MLVTPATALTTRAIGAHEWLTILYIQISSRAYVYVIIVDGVVRYIGKGRRYRAIEHFRLARDINVRRAKGQKVKAYPFHNKLAKALRLGHSVRYRVIAKDLTDAAAYALECEEMAQYPTRQLWNLRTGGTGGDADLMRSLWRKSRNAQDVHRAYCGWPSRSRISRESA